MHVLNHAKSLQSCPSLQLHGLYPPRRLSPRDSPGKNTGVSCHALLQGIFLTEWLNLHLFLLLCRQVGSSPLAPPGKPRCLMHTLRKTWEVLQLSLWAALSFLLLFWVSSGPPGLHELTTLSSQSKETTGFCLGFLSQPHSFLQAKHWGNAQVHFVCLQSPRFHCPLLPGVPYL